MPIILALAMLIFFAVLFGPQMWVRRVLAQHGGDRPDLPGTGGELARHLLDEAGLHSVKVELTGHGDHYDPEERAVRLLPQHYDGRSVAAVAVTAHEVSHAVQHARGEPGFTRRFDLVKKVIWFDRLASASCCWRLSCSSWSRHRSCGAATRARARAARDSHRRARRHLAVELDASFAKALPLLERGPLSCGARHAGPARSVLRAAAWTYVAAALATLLRRHALLRALRF